MSFDSWKRLRLPGVVLLLLAGCTGSPPPGIFSSWMGGFHSDYHLSLVRTESPGRILQESNTVLSGKPAGEERYSDYFEDNLVKVLLGMNSQLINLAIWNNSDSVLELIWDQCTYTNDSGSVSKLMHEGVNLFNQDYPLSSTYIPPDSSIAEFIYPTKYLKYKEATQYERALWERRPLFCDVDLHGPSLPGEYNTLAEYDSAVQRNVGKRISLHIPVRIAGESYAYTFHFQVDSIRSDAGVLVPASR